MNLRVLIIDDDVRIAEIHRRYVEKTEGFEVVGIANTLEDAQLQLDVLEPDLLLLDIFFPGRKRTGISQTDSAARKTGRCDSNHCSERSPFVQ